MNVELENSSCLALSDSKSSCSTVTKDDGSSAETRAHPLRMIAAVARCHEMKLKVVRKSRSKKFWRSDTRKPISIGKPTEASSERASESTSSCLSSSSSAVSSARSRGGGGGWKEEEEASLARNSKTKLPAVANSAHLRRRAESIKRILSSGCTPTSEVRIRQLLGDSPDTSKALRM
ncbi:hypothetical protein Vadar_021418 [Vaccinium darrowii]|uniref:Uncharacterized protein n=1 Tax=Vaccinium darrowii TaxID=229202 RepID=A0ACB7YPJ8_9ERIC|nr:hypothetical protein Vadar_021418 [Vaccinium darrowii]